MNENVNTPAKWLTYLLYVGIAAAVNSLLVNLSLLSGLTRWAGLAITAASIYLLFRLRDANPRYLKAAIFSAVAWVGIRIGFTPLTLVGLVCSIIAQYQEYHGHSELVEEHDAKLAGRWNSLFWAQFVGSLLLGLVVSVVGVTVVMVSGEETEFTTTLTSILSVVLSLVLKVLYLLYLNRTIKALETEFVAECVKE